MMRLVRAILDKPACNPGRRTRTLNLPAGVVDKSRLEVVTSHAGVPTLRYTKNGKPHWIHSRIDPIQEARTLANHWYDGPGSYLVLGMGLGYHVAELSERVGKDCGEVIVVEPCAEIARTAEALGLLGFLTKSSRVRVVAGDPSELLAALAGTPLDVRGESLKIRVHPVLHRLFPDEYAKYVELIRSEINRQAVNAFTLAFWETKWLENTLANVPYLLKHPPLDVLADRFAECPAFIVSAGPSLDKNVMQLRRVRARGLIIAVGTAVRSLLQVGVRPDLVVTVDGSEKNHSHTRGFDIHGVPLIFEPMVFPGILSEHKGRKFSVKTDNPAYEWLRPAVPRPTHVKAGGSVATVATDIAVQLGCNPIVFVGQDLAYTPDGKTHASATIYGKSRVDLNKASAGYLQVLGNDGGLVWTSRSLYSFRTWFERYISNSPVDRRFINATEGGARIAGTDIATLAETIDRFCIRDVHPQEILQYAHDSWEGQIPTDEVEAFLRRAADDLKRMEEDAAEATTVTRRLQEFTHQDRFQSPASRRLLRRLSTIDANLRQRDRELHAVIMGAAYRSVTHTLRTSGEVSRILKTGAKGGSVHVRGILSVLEQSYKLYHGLHDAVQRTRQIVEAAIRRA